MSFAAQDWEIGKNALIYTVTVSAVNAITAHREGSLLTMTVTCAIMTYGANVLATRLREKPPQSDLAKPLAKAGAFVATTLVAVGINMQSTLVGTYFGSLFVSEIHPIFILGSSVIGLVLLWVLGVVIGAVP